MKDKNWFEDNTQDSTSRLFVKDNNQHDVIQDCTSRVLVKDNYQHEDVTQYHTCRVIVKNQHKG